MSAASPHLLSGLVPIGQFAKTIGKCTRTVLRWMEQPDGLPYTRLGVPAAHPHRKCVCMAYNAHAVKSAP
jgi:hypothetical protein